MSSVRMKALILTVVLLCSCLAGCGSQGGDKKNESAKTESKQEAEQKKEKQEEQGEQKTADDEADSTVPNTTETVSTGSETQNGSSEKSSTDKGSQKKNNGKAPTSQRTVSLNRDRLYNMMVSVYQKPTLQMYEKESKTEFAHELRSTIPAQIQYIYDWYFGVVDGGSVTEITVPVKDAQLFDATTQAVLNAPFYYERDNGNGTTTFSMTKQEIDPFIDQQYNQYCSAIDNANKPIQEVYDAYNANIAQTKTACDLIVDAANKANIQGKDEATAVSNIIDYLCKNCEYWYEVEKNPSPDHKGERVSECLRDHHAVCNGYAKAFYAMCYYAGIDVTYYWGHTDKNVGHAWDSVKINGQEYYFDVTWHDILISSSKPKDTYVWASNAEFSKEHIQEGTNVMFW